MTMQKAANVQNHARYIKNVGARHARTSGNAATNKITIFGFDLPEHFRYKALTFK